MELLATNSKSIDIHFLNPPLLHFASSVWATFHSGTSPWPKRKATIFLTYFIPIRNFMHHWISAFCQLGRFFILSSEPPGSSKTFRLPDGSQAKGGAVIRPKGISKEKVKGERSQPEFGGAHSVMKDSQEVGELSWDPGRLAQWYSVRPFQSTEGLQLGEQSPWRGGTHQNTPNSAPRLRIM
jgi:hypothetical protein